jgi:hypothetical protein
MFPFDTTLVILIANLAQLPTRWHKTHIIKWKNYMQKLSYKKCSILVSN